MTLVTFLATIAVLSSLFFIIASMLVMRLSLTRTPITGPLKNASLVSRKR